MSLFHTALLGPGRKLRDFDDKGGKKEELSYFAINGLEKADEFDTMLIIH